MNCNLTRRASEGGLAVVTLSPRSEAPGGGPRGSDRDSCINLEVSPRSEKRGLMGENVPPHHHLPGLP